MGGLGCLPIFPTNMPPSVAGTQFMVCGDNYDIVSVFCVLSVRWLYYHVTYRVWIYIQVIGEQSVPPSEITTSLFRI